MGRGPRAIESTPHGGLGVATGPQATYGGTWLGRVMIRRGEESTVQVEVANSSAVEARFEGELVDAAEK